MFEQLSGGGPSLGVHVERLLQEVDHLFRPRVSMVRVGLEGRRTDGGCEEHGAEGAHFVTRRLSFSEFETDTSQSVYINLLPIGFSLNDFRSHPIGSSDHGGERVTISRDFTNESKITNLGRTIQVKQNVLSLDIEMSQLLHVKIVESEANLSNEMSNFRFGKIDFLIQIFECATITIFHNEPELIVPEEDVFEGDDIRMVETTHGFNFVSVFLKEISVHGAIHDLESDLLTIMDGFTSKDFAEAALADGSEVTKEKLRIFATNNLLQLFDRQSCSKDRLRHGRKIDAWALLRHGRRGSSDRRGCGSNGGTGC